MALAYCFHAFDGCLRNGLNEMGVKKVQQQFDILLVEDSPGDVRLIEEALKDRVRNKLHVVSDGVAAMAFLRREGKYSEAPRPDLILLDLNLPKKDGREVLGEIKNNEELKQIPVIVLTTSNADPDIMKSYNLQANCYVTKPTNLDQFIGVIRSIEDFWMSVAKLPQQV
jgi:two-component system, chemotaxis family, response regulator Rcp1